jgi:hypothetical protein
MGVFSCGGGEIQSSSRCSNGKMENNALVEGVCCKPSKVITPVKPTVTVDGKVLIAGDQPAKAPPTFGDRVKNVTCKYLKLFCPK